MTETASLAAALHAAQAAIPPVPRGGFNKSQGWRFVEASAVVEAARKALNDAGLVAYMRFDGHAEADNPDWLYTTLNVIYPPSGEHMTLTMPWPIIRTGDQGRRSAFTYARKQALIELLLIADPNEEDPETHAVPPPPTLEQARRIRTPATPDQILQITTELQRTTPRADWAVMCSQIIGRETHANDLTYGEAKQILVTLRRMPTQRSVRGDTHDEGRDKTTGTVAGPDATPSPAGGARPNSTVATPQAPDREGRAPTPDTIGT